MQEVKKEFINMSVLINYIWNYMDSFNPSHAFKILLDNFFVWSENALTKPEMTLNNL